jgi:hypothetical protein
MQTLLLSASESCVHPAPNKACPPNWWDSAAFSSIFLASSFSCSQTESTPAHTRITQTINAKRKPLGAYDKVIIMHSVDEFESIFFRYLTGELPIKDFEQWLYSTPQLEGYLGEPVYFEFISLNFQQPSASDELSKLIAKYLGATKFRD